MLNIFNYWFAYIFYHYIFKISRFVEQQTFSGFLPALIVRDWCLHRHCAWCLTEVIHMKSLCNYFCDLWPGTNFERTERWTQWSDPEFYVSKVQLLWLYKKLVKLTGRANICNIPSENMFVPMSLLCLSYKYHTFDNVSLTSQSLFLFRFRSFT